MTPTPAGREPAGTAPGRQVALPYEAGFFPPLCWAPLLLSPPLASRRLSLPPAPSPHGSLWPYLPLGTSSWSPRLGSSTPFGFKGQSLSVSSQIPSHTGISNFHFFSKAENQPLDLQ